MPAEINGRERTDSEMEVDGRRRLDEIRAAVGLQQSPSHPQYRSPPLLFPAYVTTVEPSDRLFIPCVGVENTFHALQLTSEGYKIVNCYSNNANNPTVEPPYYNYIHEEGRVIICAWNYRRNDTLPQLAQRKWCDILAASCVEALASNHRSAATVAAISVIWRFYIDNVQTQRLIEQLKVQYGQAPFEIDEQEPLFFALVASDHGRGLASMLRDYAWMFGFQTIVSAIIVPARDLPHLYWRLAPVATTRRVDEMPIAVSPMSRRQRRQHQKRLSRESLSSDSAFV